MCVPPSPPLPVGANYLRAVSCPALKGDDNYYFTYNSGLQAQSSIFRFAKGQEGKEVKEGEVGGELFFDVSGAMFQDSWEGRADCFGTAQLAQRGWLSLALVLVFLGQRQVVRLRSLSIRE